MESEVRNEMTHVFPWSEKSSKGHLKSKIWFYKLPNELEQTLYEKMPDSPSVVAAREAGFEQEVRTELNCSKDVV